jgi:phosphatidate phosphatase APP1
MWPVLFSLALPADQVASQIARDEVVVFFPTYAHRTADGKSWNVQIHGQIFEPEESSLRRAALVEVMERSLGLSRRDAETAIFQKRVRAFLVDNERNKTIHIQLGDKVYRAGTSGPNGHFSTELVVSAEEIERAPDDGGKTIGAVRFKAIVPADDSREFPGEVQLIELKGLSVISDVDDTIKISEVGDLRALLTNTFLREYRPVDGMAELYQGWEKAGAKFHYVSASPWQLYRSLAEFCAEEKFPRGSFHMKLFRLHDSSALALLGSQQKYKPGVIAKILEDFPERRFVLVGDSGEDDPEIFGELARKHPQQVVRVLIRDPGGNDSDRDSKDRYKAAFKDVPQERWQVFSDPAELSKNVPADIEKAD